MTKTIHETFDYYQSYGERELIERIHELENPTIEEAHKIENEILEVIDNADDMTRSDVQGRVQAIVMNIFSR